MKHVLVTGVSGGLGNAIQKFLIRKGWFVYGTSRHLSEQKTENQQILYLDLEDNRSIESLSEFFIKNDLPLDAIIHNAGITIRDPADVLTDEERKKTFQVNFFGPCLLTEKLIPLFKKRESGRIIMISSIVSIDTWPHLGVYAASKAALDKVAFEWAVLLKEFGIDVSVIRPNPLPTNMNIQRGLRADLSKDTFKIELKWESIEETLSVIEDALTNPLPQFEYYTGQFSKETADQIIKADSSSKLLQHYRHLFWWS